VSCNDTSVLIFFERFKSFIEDQYRGIIERNRKKQLQEEYISSKFKDNKRWVDYANEREAAVEEYVKMLKKNRRLNRIITLMKIREIFLKQRENLDAKIVWHFEKFKFRYLLSKILHLYKYNFIKIHHGGKSILERERMRMRHKLTFF